MIARAFHANDAASVARLLDQNPDLKKRINEPSGPFNSPAVTNVKGVEMLDVLLAAGADINAKTEWWAGGFGLLHLAPPDVAKAAIERGAVVDVHAAARLGMLDTLKKLVHDDPTLVSVRGGDGQTPLHFASTVEIAEFLLSRGAEIDALDVDHVSSPAQYMVASRQDVARFLVARGCKTDILMAAALGDLDLIGKILDRDPEAVRTRVSDEYFPMIGPKNGGTIYQWELGWHVSAYQVARRFGHDQVFDLLMERSPVEVRLLAHCWLGNEAEVDFLLAEHPEIATTLQDAEKRQVAHAARNNDLNAVRLMLRAGVPVNARSQHNATTLHWAAWHGNVEMVREVLKCNPALDDRENDYEGTPLGWASYGSEHGWAPEQGDYAATVGALLAAGATPPEKASGTETVQFVLRKHGVRD
jgi:ankyrin repeat protein